MREILERGRSRGYVLSLVFTVILLGAGFILPVAAHRRRRDASGRRGAGAAGAGRGAVLAAAQFGVDVEVVSSVPDRATAEARSATGRSTPCSSSREDLSAPGELIVHEERRAPGPGDRQPAPSSRSARPRRRRCSAPPTVVALEPPTRRGLHGADLRQRRDHHHVHRHLLVRHLGADRRRRGEAEPGRRGRPVDRPAARPADGQGPRDRRCSPWPSSSSWSRPGSSRQISGPARAAPDDRSARSSSCSSGSSSGSRSTRRRWASSGRSRRGWRRRPTPRCRSR